MTAKRTNTTAEVIDILVNSEIGQTINEKLRQILGLPNLPPSKVSEKMKAEAKDVGEKIRRQMNDPYVILGVDRNADIVVIKAAYKALAKKYHEAGTTPDEKMMKSINQAYDAIMKEKGQK